MPVPPADLQLRPATEHDTPTLREIYLRCRQRSFPWFDASALQLADFDADTAEEPILVALAGAHVAGFVSWWPPENFIHNLFVDPAFARLGIGSELLATCLLTLGRPATLKCVQANTAALAFYQRHGWRIAGTGESADAAYYLLQLD